MSGLTGQKFLQYETVLGPETDESAPVPRTASGQPVDEEKAVSGPTAAISGPGLGDLLTIGNKDAVSHYQALISCDLNTNHARCLIWSIAQDPTMLAWPISRLCWNDFLSEKDDHPI